MSANGSRQDEDSRLPATSEDGGPPDAQDGSQPATEAATAALAEADAQDGSGVSVTHVRAATFGPRRDARVTHSGYLLLKPSADGRTGFARMTRRLRAHLAQDWGFTDWESLPAARRVLAEQFIRLYAAADVIYASFLANGRLPDRWLDFVNTLERYGKTLGLERGLKDARVHDPIAEKYGRNGGPAAPAGLPDRPSSANERATEAVRAAQEAEKP